jgi:hypothetical protein
VKRRSNLWLICLLITVMAVSASATAILFRHHFGELNPGYVLIDAGVCLLLVLVTAALGIAERGRRSRVAARRRERDAERVRQYELEVNRARHEAAEAAMRQRRRDTSLFNRTVAEMIEKAKMDEPTYVLPPAITYLRGQTQPTRIIAPTQNRDREALQAQLLRDLMTETGEIRL